MKMTKIIRKLMTGLGAAVLTATLAVGSIPAQAAGTGTIKIQPKLGDTQLGSSDYKGTFDVYKVADFDPAIPTITYVDPFTSYNSNESYNSIDKISDSATFTQLVKAIAADYEKLDKSKLTKVASGIGAGKSKDSIPFGLYLVAQSSSDSNYYDVSPFLVFLPQATGAAETATATAYPKLEKKPTPPPVTPPDGGGDEGGDDGGDDNPPTPPKPPVTPPKEEEGEDEETPETPETPEQPGEDIGNMGDDGMMTDGEGGMMTDAGAMTGDNSQMTTYAAVAGVAAVALIGWVVWKKRSKRQQ